MDVITVNKSNINGKMKDHSQKNKEIKKDYEKRNKKENTVEEEKEKKIEYGENAIKDKN